MNLRLLFPILVALALGLSACGKTEDQAEQTAAPATGAAQEEKAAAAPATEAAKEAPAAPKPGQ
jgi:hypothetical protein